MLDYRVYTFLNLCETLSYTQTAHRLQMTQPGVTQHIQFLEKEYGCRLLRYEGRTLSLTEEGESLAGYLRAALRAEREERRKISAPQVLPLRIGATKTIGDFVIDRAALTLAADPRYCLSLLVDNTDRLLKKLDQAALDLALIEGFVDKAHYAHQLLRREPFLGICAREHPFAGQAVPLEELFSQHIILREQGSGTRSILEGVLRTHNYTVQSFRQETCCSSFQLLQLLVARNIGISFVYAAVAQRNPALATFTIQGEDIRRELNYVYIAAEAQTPWFLPVFQSAMETAWNGTGAAAPESRP